MFRYGMECTIVIQRLGGEISRSFTDIKFERSEFEIDYSRIVSSASFRRLQDKTQVFPLDSSDFVRTRLTHSLDDKMSCKYYDIIQTNVRQKRTLMVQ